MKNTEIQDYYKEYCPKHKAFIDFTFDPWKMKACGVCGKCGGQTRAYGHIITKGQVVVMDEEKYG